MDPLEKLPLEIVRIVCEFVAVDLASFFKIFVFSKGWNKLDKDERLWFSVGLLYDVLTPKEFSIFNVKRKLQQRFYQDLCRNEICEYIAQNPSPTPLIDINAIIKKHGDKTGYWNSSSICSIGIMMNSIEILNFGWGRTYHYSTESLKSECAKKSSILLFDAVVALAPSEIESIHFSDAVGSSTLQFAKHYISIRSLPEEWISRILNSAIKAHNNDLVKHLIDNGANLHLYTHNSLPIHEAAIYRNMFALQLLLNKGCDVNSIDLNGRNVLFVALSYHTWTKDFQVLFSVVELLIKHGADVNYVDSSGSCLHFCCEEVAFLRLILEKQPNTINFRDERGNTPLHIAMSKSNLECIVLLLQNNADLTILNNNKISPLQLLSNNPNWFPIVKYLIEQGINMNLAHEPGSTFMHFAARRGQTEAIMYLIDSGMDINACEDGFTPLFCALPKTSVFTIRFLLDMGANVNAKNIDGDTPLHVVARMGRPRYVELLLRYKADIFAKNNCGHTPFDVAVGLETCFCLIKAEFPNVSKAKLQHMLKIVPFK